MRALFSHLVLASTLGCGSAAYTYSGYWASNHFPIEDNWTWDYTNEGEDFLLRAETTNREANGETEVVTIDYKIKETNNLLYSIKWSSDKTDGIQIHGYYIAEPFAGSGDDDGGGEDTGSGTDAVVGEWVLFSPPVKLASRQAEAGATIETSANGVTYESFFEAYEDCPNLYAIDWSCMKVTVTSDDDGAAPFEGTWHWAAEYGTSLFQPAGSDFPWTLAGEPRWTEAN